MRRMANTTLRKLIDPRTKMNGGGRAHVFSLHLYLNTLTAQLRGLHHLGLLPKEAFTNGAWNKNSWLHSRVFGALVQAVHRPLLAHVEVCWSRNFHPDLCIVDPNEHVQAIIEYESTNSSDERLFGKDIWHFEEAILSKAPGSDDPPPWWVLISTLPTCRVKNWSWYAWNTSLDYPPASKD